MANNTANKARDLLSPLAPKSRSETFCGLQRHASVHRHLGNPRRVSSSESRNTWPVMPRVPCTRTDWQTEPRDDIDRAIKISSECFAKQSPSWNKASPTSTFLTAMNYKDKSPYFINKRVEILGITYEKSKLHPMWREQQVIKVFNLYMLYCARRRVGKYEKVKLAILKTDSSFTYEDEIEFLEEIERRKDKATMRVLWLMHPKGFKVEFVSFEISDDE